VESHQLGAAFIEWSSNEQSVSAALSRIGHTITANSSALRHNLISNFISDWAQVIKIKIIIFTDINQYVF
jgi:hypothetical protein